MEDEIIHGEDDVSSDDDHDIDYELEQRMRSRRATGRRQSSHAASPPAGSYQAGQGAVKLERSSSRRARQRREDTLNRYGSLIAKY
eukprot:gene30292-35280_t